MNYGQNIVVAMYVRNQNIIVLYFDLYGADWSPSLVLAHSQQQLAKFELSQPYSLFVSSLLTSMCLSASTASSS